MVKKILTIVLILVLVGIGLWIKPNPIVIVIGFFAIMNAIKKEEEKQEASEREKSQKLVDDFMSMMESFAEKSDSNPKTDDDGEYVTRQAGFFTVKEPKHPQQPKDDSQHSQADSKPHPESGPKQPQTDFKPKSEPVPHYTEEQAKRLLRYISDSTGKDTVRIRPALADTSLPFEKRVCSSRFGGFPYWTRGEEYPAAEDGEKLYLLAQINFAEVPHIGDFPTRGLLQIFIKDDGGYGCSFDTQQKDWRIVWREIFSPGLAMSEAELREMGVKCAGEEVEKIEDMPLPLQKEYSLSFEKTKTFCHPHLDGFDGVLKNAAQVLGFFVYDKSCYELFDSDSISAFYSDDAQHQIGGYPDFTQDDVRREGDILLFQIDSAGEINWGDSGIANFFISPSDLKARDFSNVLYNWDCY